MESSRMKLPAILQRKRPHPGSSCGPALPAGVVALKKSSAQLMEDIDSAFADQDVVIVCRSQDGGFETTRASSLLLSVASQYLKSVFDSVAVNCDEAPYIILPDFDLSDVDSLLRFMRKAGFIFGHIFGGVFGHYSTP